MPKKIKLPPASSKEINYLVDKYKFILLEFKDGYAYLLLHHHKYLDPYHEAPRSKICKSPRPDKYFLIHDNFLYLTDAI